MNCTDPRVVKTLSLNEDLSYLKTKYCEHSQVFTLVFHHDDLKKGLGTCTEKEFVEVLNTRKNYGCLVIPGSENVTKPGVVVLTARTLKPRCDRCSGKTCIHLTIHRKKYDDDMDSIGNSALRISLLGLKEKNLKTDGKIVDDSVDRSGGVQQIVESNDNDSIEEEEIVGFKIPFPLTPDMKKQFLQQSLSTCPFPAKKLIPKYNPSYQCKCGFSADPRCPFKMNWVANDPVYIHHTRFVPDGRTERLIAYYRPMVNPHGEHLPPPCNHQLHYEGHQDLLLRVTKTGRNHNIGHFVSYELLFKYLIDFF